MIKIIISLAALLITMVTDDYYANSPINNPQGPLTGTEKTLRGGGPTDDGTVSNNYGRDGNKPNAKNGGFRCVINSTLPMAELKAQAMGKEPDGGILVYRHDPKSQTLRQIWNS